MPFHTLANSTFLDAFGANLATAPQFAAVAAGDSGPLIQLFQSPGTTVTAGTAKSSATITVGLVLDRAADPSALLAGNWAERQAALKTFADAPALWAAYGAHVPTYDAVRAAVRSVVGDQPLHTAAANGYLSSAADRTIWLTLDPTQFQALFGQPLQELVTRTPGSPSSTTLAWTGSLGLDSAIPVDAIKGLWVEQEVAIPNPTVLVSTLSPVAAGPLGIGNGVNTPSDTGHVIATPAAIAANYKFPLRADAATAPIALVETDIALQSQLFSAYNQYRQQVGLPTVTAEQFQILSGTNNPAGTIIQEVTLDISVVAGAVPNSTQLIYSELSAAGGTPFNAYQQAFFDDTNDPAVLSSSYPVLNQPTASSPFQWAWQQLFVDGALANVSVHMAGGDQGSSANIPNGAANVLNSHSSPFTLIVGGTSIAGLYSALSDTTLTEMVRLALLDDPATVFLLVAAGLRTLPSQLSDAEPSPGQATTLKTLFETVWQGLSMVPGTQDLLPVLEAEFGANQTGSGGVASTAIPSYQRDYGLSGLTNGRRGTPDVAAMATGDTSYASLDADYVNGTASTLVHGDGGTSSAAPLWASLTTQINTIFRDQGLPDLGYYNDLLYTAAAVAPGSFNDVQLGNNINSFFTPNGTTPYYNTNLDVFMIPTGEGYAATAGYDLASGLGTPNGVLLARALTTIAHAQVSSKAPAVFGAADAWSAVSTISQTLLVQDELGAGTSSVLWVGDGGPVAAVGGSPLAWTSRLAQQSLQKDFDPALALLFDGAAQGTSYSVGFNAGQGMAVFAASTPLPLYQANLTNPFGLVQFGDAGGDVTLARPVAVAQTAGGADHHDAILRLRQVTPDTLMLGAYRVDDFNGTIGGIAPGQAGYADAATARDYLTDNGTTVITGPGHGNYGEARLKGVKAGDIVALHLTNATTRDLFWGFAAANETVDGASVNHLWSYGLNTFGWEATRGGGDRDHNDLIVGIDFTSASGHGLIA